MNAYLLYSQKEWANIGRYSDDRTIAQDLGLKALFSAAAKEIEKEDGKIKLISEADPFLEDTMKKVMMIPLGSREEILYRQEILRDCYEDERLIYELYELSGRILTEWDKLGRRASARTNSRSPRSLVTEIHVLQLFSNSLGELKGILRVHEDSLHSAGFTELYRRLQEAFDDGFQAALDKILKDVAFYANEKEHGDSGSSRVVDKPRIVFGCRIGDGLKPGDFRLESVETQVRRYRAPGGGALERAQEYINSRLTASFSVRKGIALQEQADMLEYQTAQYIVSCCTPFFDAFSGFFDQLHFQAAFYRGAVNIKHFMERFQIRGCFPEVGERGSLRFVELKELVMAFEQRLDPVGNSCSCRDKRLLVVTGANQGGKSTFLRSIGIAQIMMQCGLAVAADRFESGIYPSFFTHFTRREDSAMNSGRLNEELGRMSQIVDRLEEGAIVFLNESFASTTEKEGSVIAYEIIRALTEAGVEVLTVTHLLSFAQRIYEESCQNPESEVEFLSAQRMEDGRRTFKMIQHAPELTSFGLDLYDEIILRQNAKKF